MAGTTKNILWIGADRPTIQPYLDLVRIRLGREADYYSIADEGLVAARTTQYPLIMVRDIVGASNDFVRKHHLPTGDFPAFSQELIRVMASEGLNSKTPIIAIGNAAGNYVVPAKYTAAGAREFWDLLEFNSREFEERVKRILV